MFYSIYEALSQRILTGLARFPVASELSTLKPVDDIGLFLKLGGVRMLLNSEKNAPIEAPKATMDRLRSAEKQVLEGVWRCTTRAFR
jgi:hypothetical protein